MKRRPSLLKKIWRKLVSPKPAPATKSHGPARKVSSSLEPLEGRISPAALINPTTLLYKDIDGDMVTVKFTKSIFSTTPTGLGIANNVFQFSTGTIDGTTTTPQQLLLIDLTKAPTSGVTSLANGSGLTISAVKAGGDGVADVGYINAAGITLAAVSVSGDLGQIDAGSVTAKIAVASLKTKTLGVRDPAVTQPVTGRSLVSNLTGALGSLTVTGDVNTASVLVVNSAVGLGKIGAVTIGGSLKGRVATEALSDSTGLISASSDIGLVKIGTVATDGIIGGGGTNAGSVQAGGKIAGLTVSGVITGGTGTGSGAVHSTGALGPVSVGHNITGAAGANSGVISAGGITSVTLGGSIFGGGTGAGNISSTSTIGTVKVSGSIDGTTATSTGAGGIRATGNIGAVTVLGDLKGGTQASSGILTSSAGIGLISIHGIAGGAGQNSGAIAASKNIAGLNVTADITGAAGIGSGTVHAVGTLGAVNVKGSLAGGTVKDAGAITAAGIGAVTFGGSIVGHGTDLGSGVVASKKAIGNVIIAGGINGLLGVAGLRATGNIGSVTIAGDVKGGPQVSSGFIDSGADLGAVSVKSITGGAGQNSGSITAAGKILSVTVKNDVTGAGGIGSGSVFSGLDSTKIGDLGAVKIGGKLVGGSQDDSGTISSGGKILSVTIGPAAPPATQLDLLSGGGGNNSGSVFSRGAMGAVHITGNVMGGAGAFSGAIWSQDLMTSSSESAGDLGVVTITGHVQGGGGNDSGEIRADGKLAGATTGSLFGAGGARSASIRAGQGSIHNGAGAITIKGDMDGAGILSETGGIISEGRIASILVTGSISGGAIRAGDDIGAITVNHDVSALTQISARGQAVQGVTTDLAFGRITINGNVSDTRIRAGYDTSLINAVNPDAQIGSVFVKGNWTTSDLFEGVIAGPDHYLGNGDDAKSPGTDHPKIVSQIASIIIGGTVSGTVGGIDHYGFVAQKIVAMRVGPMVVHLTAGTDVIDIGTTGDVTVRELGV